MHRPYKCENPDCAREFTKDELKAVNAKMGWNIPDISERVAPGEVFPVAECRFCHALVHEKPENAVAPEPGTKVTYPHIPFSSVLDDLDKLVDVGTARNNGRGRTEQILVLLVLELRKLSIRLEDIEGAIRDGGA